jgi:hypothetical protein
MLEKQERFTFIWMYGADVNYARLLRTGGDGATGDRQEALRMGFLRQGRV